MVYKNMSTQRLNGTYQVTNKNACTSHHWSVLRTSIYCNWM